MAKIFNVNGVCIPSKHYMVELKPRLEAIKEMIEAGEYFAVNKARQYGKTTTLRALSKFLKKDYEVVNLDFQRMSSLSFERCKRISRGEIRIGDKILIEAVV